MNGFLGEVNRFLDQYLTPAVKTIIVTNVLITFIIIILDSINPGFNRVVGLLLGQFPPFSVHRFFIWQFLTYMFIHVSVLHLLFNMWALWMFGPTLEGRWGTRRFWTFYLTTGVGAGLLHAIISLLFVPGERVPIIGASGAIYGVMLAYAAYYPNQMMLFNFIIPMKIKYFMIILGLFAFFSTATGGGGGVSNLTHLTGLLVAYVSLAIFHKEWDIRRWQWR